MQSKLGISTNGFMCLVSGDDVVPAGTFVHCWLGLWACGEITKYQLVVSSLDRNASRLAKSRVPGLAYIWLGTEVRSPPTLVSIHIGAGCARKRGFLASVTTHFVRMHKSDK
eukprot:5102868-Amphidinium_carterae.1